MSETVEVPVSLLKRMVEAREALAGLEEELEDYLIAQDPDLLTRLERARGQHQRGELRPFAELLDGT